VSILTVKELREMIADLPDETPVILAVRCDQNEDYFHDALPVEGFSLGVDDPDHEPILTVGEIGCDPVFDDHPDGGYPHAPREVRKHWDAVRKAAVPA
jgi:hypothetical protein